MTRTHYEVLGVPRDASSMEIEAAFRERTNEFRERTYAGVDTLEDVREAYRVLANFVSRAGYDETLPLVRPAKPKAGGVPGWIKWALPFAIVVGVAGVVGWMKWTESRDFITKVGPIKRIPVEEDDPTRPAPVTIPPPAPLEPGPEVSVASAGSGAAGTGVVAGTVVALRGNAEEVFAAAAPSIARVLAMDLSGRPLAQGSGVVVSPGVVVTNCHVTKDSYDITVKVGREEYRATALSSDEEHDLCRLSVSGLGAPPASMGSVKDLRTGQRVFAIGAPQGLELTISEGIVSSLRPVPDGTMIQTSAPISPGSSGGGLFDGSGRLVGIVTFQHRFGQNLNFAVPADWLPEAAKR